MVTEKICKRKLKLKYTIIEDGKEKNITQNYSNVKLTATKEELFAVADSIKSLMNVPAVSIEKEDSYIISN